MSRYIHLLKFPIRRKRTRDNSLAVDIKPTSIFFLIGVTSLLVFDVMFQYWNQLDI